MDAEQEVISLHYILELHDVALKDIELWAVCQECCEALINMDITSDDCSTLCITPETVLFDSYGNVSFRLTDIGEFWAISLENDLCSSTRCLAVFCILGQAFLNSQTIFHHFSDPNPSYISPEHGKIHHSSKVSYGHIL